MGIISLVALSFMDTKSTEAGALSVARGKQVSIANWKRPEKMQKT
jgi:bifunctional UDP-N-acetylglucosamine pyrophosphorylase/glucosamine-1-phosphate N-acetyltransferase